MVYFDLNKQTMYSLDDIQLFDLDIFTNKNTQYKIRVYANTQIISKELLKMKTKTYFLTGLNYLDYLWLISLHTLHYIILKKNILQKMK